MGEEKSPPGKLERGPLKTGGESEYEKNRPRRGGGFIKGRDERLGFGGFRESHTNKTGNKFLFWTANPWALPGKAAEMKRKTFQATGPIVKS